LDPEGFAELYRRHVTMVRRRALRLLGSPGAADDVAQQAFVQLIEYRRQGGTDRETPAFLYRTATNLALNVLRDGKRRRELLGAHWAGPEATVEATSDRIAMRKVLALVPEEEAQIASYYYVDGLEHQEIADLLGLERRTVGRRLERFQKRALELLAEPKGEEGGEATHVDVERSHV
jgi:RNA polymerase sigma-70 factor (ECF subfamily)